MGVINGTSTSGSYQFYPCHDDMGHGRAKIHESTDQLHFSTAFVTGSLATLHNLVVL